MITKKELLRNGLFNSKKIVIEQDEEDYDDTYDTNDDDDNEDTDESDHSSNVGKVKLYKLDKNVIKILTDRIKDEYTAHYYYRAASNWCQDMNYKKAAEFFKNESNDELTHAEKIQEYMTGFNIIPEIPQAPTKHKFDSLIGIINGAYTMELSLMKEYNKNSQDIFSEDITTFDFLTEFREIQKGAVVEYNDLINASELVNMKDKFQVLYFEQTYF
jgi:ferritin